MNYHYFVCETTVCNRCGKPAPKGYTGLDDPYFCNDCLEEKEFKRVG